GHPRVRRGAGHRPRSLRGAAQSRRGPGPLRQPRRRGGGAEAPPGAAAGRGGARWHAPLRARPPHKDFTGVPPLIDFGYSAPNATKRCFRRSPVLKRTLLFLLLILVVPAVVFAQ